MEGAKMGREENKGNERVRRDRPKKKVENVDTQMEEQRKRRQEQLARQEMKSSEKHMAEPEKKESQEPSTPEQPAEAIHEEPEVAERRERAGCPIVGVGASAGGLEALQGLFDHVPNEPPMAFVVVQHRAADHTSVMKSLLEKHTNFRVEDIEDGMKVQPGTLYLAPPDRDVAILNGVFHLVEPSAPGLRLPIRLPAKISSLPAARSTREQMPSIPTFDLATASTNPMLTGFTTN